MAARMTFIVDTCRAAGSPCLKTAGNRVDAAIITSAEFYSIDVADVYVLCVFRLYLRRPPTRLKYISRRRNALLPTQKNLPLMTSAGFACSSHDPARLMAVIERDGCECLLQRSATSGGTALHEACGMSTKRHDVINAVDRLVAIILSNAVGRTTVNQKDVFGRTPLFLVAQSARHPNARQTRAMLLLLQHGAQPGCNSLRYTTVDRPGSALLRLYRRMQSFFNATDCESASGWRPHLNCMLPRVFRDALRAIVILRKARRRGGSAFPDACLCILPEELMQYLFLFITCRPLENAWLPSTVRSYI